VKLREVGPDNQGLHVGGQRNAAGHKHAAAGHRGAERVVVRALMLSALTPPPTGLPLVAYRAKSR
jgi:hypothetical protein